MKGGACKNKANLETRENKVTATVRQINTTASTDLIRGVETRVILILYEKSAIPSLINNCESWTLSPAEENQVDKIGIKALKRLFIIQSPYNNTWCSSHLQFRPALHYPRNRQEKTHWTNKMLFHLLTCNMGWARNISENLPNTNLRQTRTQ